MEPHRLPQTHSVLVRAALPGAVRVSEVDGEADLDLQLNVLGELFAAVPRQRVAQLFGQGGHLRGERVRIAAAP